VTSSEAIIPRLLLALLLTVGLVGTAEQSTDAAGATASSSPRFEDAGLTGHPPEQQESRAGTPSMVIATRIRTPLKAPAPSPPSATLRLTQPTSWVNSMTIPPFVKPGGYLPPGEYDATLKEIETRFTWNYGRRQVFSGLKFVLGELISHSVDIIWVDGSFVTGKERPRDVDVAYEIPDGADPWDWGLLSPPRRRDLWRYQRVDLLHYWHDQPEIKEYFCQDNGVPKGIVRFLVEPA
jgi:hypothetical protein